MALIPNWMLGRHITALTVQPLVADVNGNLTTNGAALSFLGILEGFRYEGRTTTEQINAIASPIDNEVPLEDDDQFMLREILRKGAGQQNLAAIWQNTGVGEYALVTMTRAVNTRTFYCLMQDYGESGARGKWVGELTFAFVDAQGSVVANPAYA